MPSLGPRFYNIIKCLWSDLRVSIPALSCLQMFSVEKLVPRIWAVAQSGGNANISWGIIVQQISNRNSIWQSKLQRLSQNTTDDGDMCKNIVQCFAGLLAPDIASSSRMSLSRTSFDTPMSIAQEDIIGRDTKKIYNTGHFILSP